jgi:hypothetical protein
MYKEKLCVVGVNIEIVEHWREALKKHPIAWYNWNDGIIYNLYNTKGSGIPLFVLILTVISSINGMAMLSYSLEKVLQLWDYSLEKVLQF